MRSKSYFFLLIVLALTIGSALLYRLKDYQLGLDVRGGVRLTYQMDTSQLTSEQRGRIGDVRSNIISILTNRVSSSLGVVEGNVQSKGQDQFIVELPGFQDEEQARKVLSETARILAYHAKNVVTDKAPYRQYQAGEQQMVDGNPVILFTKSTDRSKTLKPGDPEYAAMIRGWDLILAGEDLEQARPEIQGTKTVPSFRFSPSGARKLESWSRRVLSLGENMAFVLDGRVLSIAPLKDNTILSTDAFIDGTFTPEYVNSLCKLLNSGALPVDLKETSVQTLDPTIGKDALRQIIVAGLASFGIVALFLLVYYLFPGFVALLALCLYVLFTLTVLKLIGATFSLAAIAGFILSVGIAVDANILVFERVKEELRAGKPLMNAIQLGFRRALPAIIDSNACTILSALVLVMLGSGPVKGFASTLIIGVLISLFTAVTVTRSLLVFFVGSGLGSNPKLFGLNRQWFSDKIEEGEGHAPLQIVNTSTKWFLISIATIVPGVIFIALGGLKPNVEFRGGSETTIQVTNPQATTQSILANLEAKGLRGSNVKLSRTSDGSVFANLTVPPSPMLPKDSGQARQFIADAAGLPRENVRAYSAVGPSIRAETVRNAILGVVISSALIVLYLTLRFGFGLGGFRSGVRFGLSAIGALLHDVLVVLGIAAIVGYFFNWEIGTLFLTAMLTVIGFSVHDTIVVFDRIRENLRRPHQKEDFASLANRSITQSYARSINTSLTVILTLVVLVILGTPTIDLKFFCLAMLVGIVSGTYSSIYNAAPILYLWDKAIERNRGPEATLVAEAEREHQRLRLASLTVDGRSVGATDKTGQSYSQVRRRSSAVEQSKRRVDED